LRRWIEEAFRRKGHQFRSAWPTLYIGTSSGREVVVVLHAHRPLSETDRTLIELFASKLSVAFDNVILYEQLQEANARLEERVNQRTRELTAANRRLAAQWARLQRANAFKREILGTVAHDLRNPLSVIIGRAEILERMLSDPEHTIENTQAQIKHIHSAADRLTDMVDSLIADAMADALNIAIRREPVDLATLVKDVVEANQPLAAKKQQFIHVSAPAGKTFACDGDRIREAVDNLLSNAIKYSPIGGRIELSVDLQPDGAQIRVKDEGPGMSAKDISRLYGRFQRLSAKPTGGESSIGLGLSIVKRIIDLHGGAIGAESPGPGHGTTFTLTLPVAKEEDAGEQPG
jgi:signal transduction histidine kinase